MPDVEWNNFATPRKKCVNAILRRYVAVAVFCWRFLEGWGDDDFNGCSIWNRNRVLRKPMLRVSFVHRWSGINQQHLANYCKKRAVAALAAVSMSKEKREEERRTIKIAVFAVHLLLLSIKIIGVFCTLQLHALLLCQWCCCSYLYSVPNLDLVEIQNCLDKNVFSLPNPLSIFIYLNWILYGSVKMGNTVHNMAISFWCHFHQVALMPLYPAYSSFQS